MTFDWKTLIAPIEMGIEVASSVLIPGGAAFAPLEAQLFSSFNPLLQSIGTGKVDVTTESVAVYGTLIAVLNIAKTAKGISADTVAKIDEYLAAAMAAMTAYVKAGQGFDPTVFSPVAPIVLPQS